MLFRCSIASIAVAAAMSLSGAQAHDESKYPDWAGQWRRPPGVNNQWEPTRPRGQEGAPLIPEYQAIFEANLKDQAEGGQGTDPTYQCIPDGMPRAMNVIFPMEIIIQPNTTYIHIEYLMMLRRIYTDGRDFPANADASFMGYSIGKWLDTDGDGRYDTLEVETRGFKGPRVYDASGIPLHSDNATIIHERIYLDKADRNLMRNDMSIIDHALTQPWVVKQSYRRIVSDKPMWFSHDTCGEGNNHVVIGKENYFLSADGFLMPTKKEQLPPDLRYFKK